MPAGKETVLKVHVPQRTVDLVPALAAAARARRISTFRLGAEILRLSRGRQQLGWKEYFLYGAQQTHLTAEERQEFLGEDVTTRMNFVLTAKPNGLTGMFQDKLLTDMILTRAGIAVAPVRATATTRQSSGPYPVLRDVGSIVAFLRETPLPFFAKPANNSRSVGAISVTDRNGMTLRLGDGTEADIAALADEIFRLFPNGYLFQDLMVPHPDLARIVGPVISSLRIVTLRVGSEILALYSAMKMPGPGQMVDDIVSIVNTMCSVDVATGRIIRGHDAQGLGGQPMLHNPVTGAELAGAQLPLWPQVVQLAINAHEPFVEQGLLGTDIAITENGPKVIEINANPYHSFYQKSHARGFWNDDIAPRMKAALAAFGHSKPTRQLAFP